MAARPALLVLLTLLGVCAHARKLTQDAPESLYAAVSALPALSTLKTAIDTAGLQEALSDPNLEVTVLVPNNAAFQDLLDDDCQDGDEDSAGKLCSLDQVLADKERLTKILQYHVITQLVPTSAWPATGDAAPVTVPTLLEGATLQLDTEEDDGQLELQVDVAGSDAKLTADRDVKVGKSLVHVIDEVLLPAL
ncbi:beta-Ig-H3 fasciclin [Micractinium conductrix]|uniref:Beta-Ig-H3 fasciclin n=1 Tax=Micractinium conductrix TaxID=554055 RepID=A0A2P6V6L9_9CHLO|nr:beta-Ig-H3 fasciclin [Micractinium conductrix]|eukprot:PSC69735.1 beta-Ig-H3 fasciclin [Micractinium conductrix]